MAKLMIPYLFTWQEVEASSDLERLGLAHNLTRELQMRTEPKARGTTERRTPLWHFEELATLRHHVLQRAGRFTWPKGKLTLTITDNPALRKDIVRFLDALKEAA